MALSVRGCASEDLHITCRVEAHLRTFPQTDSGTQLANRGRGSNAAGFNVGRQANTA